MAERPFVHESATVEEGAVLGDGCRVWRYCHVMSGARLGRDVVLGQNGFVAAGVVVGDGSRIQNNVSLYAGVELGEGVFVGPSVVFTNVRRPRALFPRKDSFESTQVGAGATLGANSTVVCGTRIGEAAMVGAGAVVTHDVPSFALVMGAPARLVGWVCRCGESLSFPPNGNRADCSACARAYRFDEGQVMEAPK